jgi:hypothetical protein
VSLISPRPFKLNRESIDLMPQDLEHLRDGCRELIDATSTWIQQASESNWQPPSGDDGRGSLSNLVFRAIAVKQFESVVTIRELDNRENGFAAVPLLRAMCEEMIWVYYLSKLDSSTRSSIVACLASAGLHETFVAQESYGIPNRGFPENWKDALAAQAHQEQIELRQIIKAQGFTLGSKQTTPSFRQIAKRVGMEKEYDFLYHATSRAVHFSVPELLRRIWGRPGSMKISSQTFERYWAAFSLYWGCWLFSMTFIEILVLLQSPGIDDQAVLRIQTAMERIKERGAMPILTTQEVYWPAEWK